MSTFGPDSIYRYAWTAGGFGDPPRGTGGGPGSPNSHIAAPFASHHVAHEPGPPRLPGETDSEYVERVLGPDEDGSAS